MPWEPAPHLPFESFSNPIAQWDVLPSFVIGEVLFISLAIAALWHARSKGRDHVLVWVGALIAGTANDFIFMALPLVDNFWQAQGTVMLTPRMPLYIPCVYICFMYVPTVTVRRLQMPALATATLTGLIASLFYAPYDIIGAKFLWWTWHDTDQPIAARLLGAPCSSSLWVMTFSASFAWLIHHSLRRGDTVNARVFGKALFFVAAFSTGIMMIQMTVLQQLDGGTPGYVALVTTAVLYAGLAWRGYRSSQPAPAVDVDRVFTKMVFAYFGVLTLIMAVFDPATHVSTGVHQLPGKCHVEAKDITGLTRHEFLCVMDFEEDYTFECAKPPSDNQEWYTICGKPHSSYARWLGGVGGLGILGCVLFGGLRSVPPRD
jgi:hypothetical protein